MSEQSMLCRLFCYFMCVTYFVCPQKVTIIITSLTFCLFLLYIFPAQPYVHITPKASWKRPGEDLLLICRLILPIMDSSSEEASPNVRSFQGTKDASPSGGSVRWTWLFNGIPLRELPKSDRSSGSNNNSDTSPNNNHNNKYIFENSTTSGTEQGGGSEISRLRIQEIYFQDMGSYSCQAENSAGIGSATASLVVIDPNSKPGLIHKYYILAYNQMLRKKTCRNPPFVYGSENVILICLPDTVEAKHVGTFQRTHFYNYLDDKHSIKIIILNVDSRQTLQYIFCN